MSKGGAGLGLIAYLLVINLTAFILCGSDKRRAVKNKYRIPERTLILISLAGGAWGFWLGMGMFRHKTKHMKFVILIPLFCIIWLGIIMYIFLK